MGDGAGRSGDPAGISLAREIRGQIFVWIGIVGGALTIVSHWSNLITLADWMRWVVSHFSGILDTFWRHVGSFIGIAISHDLACLLSVVSFYIGLTLGAIFTSAEQYHTPASAKTQITRNALNIFSILILGIYLFFFDMLWSTNVTEILGPIDSFVGVLVTAIIVFMAIFITIIYILYNNTYFRMEGRISCVDRIELYIVIIGNLVFMVGLLAGIIFNYKSKILAYLIMGVVSFMYIVYSGRLISTWGYISRPTAFKVMTLYTLLFILMRPILKDAMNSMGLGVSGFNNVLGIYFLGFVLGLPIIFSPIRSLAKRLTFLLIGVGIIFGLSEVSKQVEHLRTTATTMETQH